MKRIYGRGEQLPSEFNHDIYLVALRDGRTVIVTGMEACAAGVKNREAIRKFALELAYDADRVR